MTFEEYLDLVVQTVAKNIKPGRHSITAASLGGLLKQASPDANWKTFGKRTLGELLAESKLQERLQIVQTDKDALAVALVGAAPVAESAHIEVFNPLRKSVWDAFVLLSPGGRRFMHRANGTIRVGLEIAPPPADEWVEIVPIATEAQREWAEAFLQSADGERFVGAEQTLEPDSWHPYLFVQALRAIDEKSARLWNRFRSAKVSAHVKEWLTQNSLQPRQGFQVPNQQPREDIDEPIVALEPVAAAQGEETRRAILLALSSLPLERLLEIPIPAGIMLSALSKAKAR